MNAVISFAVIVAAVAAVLVTGIAARPSQAHLVAAPTPAALVTTFMRSTVGARVVAIEAALAKP